MNPKDIKICILKTKIALLENENELLRNSVTMVKGYLEKVCDITKYPIDNSEHL